MQSVSVSKHGTVFDPFSRTDTKSAFLYGILKALVMSFCLLLYMHFTPLFDLIVLSPFVIVSEIKAFHNYAQNLRKRSSQSAR